MFTNTHPESRFKPCRQILAVLGVLIATTAFAGPTVPSPGPIVIGGDHNYPPFEFLNENGQPAGFNVDLTRAIARELGLDIQIRLGPWEDIRKELIRGDIDAVQGMFYSAERDATLDFTAPHTVTHHVSVVRKGQGNPPTTLAELAGKRIVVQRGDIMHDLLVENGLTDMVSGVGSQEEALRALAQGRFDCALVARLTALYWIQAHGWDNLTAARQALLSPGYCYAVKQNHKPLLAQLGEGLKVLDENGQYRHIYEKWLGVYEDPRPALPTLLRYAAVVVIPLLLLFLVFFLWSWFLRRQVARRTAELHRSEQQYRLLADNTLDAIWIMNLDLEFTYINPAGFQLTGHTPAEWIGSRLPDHCDADNFAAMSREIAAEVARGPKSAGVFFEAVILKKNRQPLPVEIHGKVIFDANGRPTGLQGVTRDISERKQAQEALRYQDRLLRDMGRIAKIGAWEFDPGTGKGTWTDEVARIHDLDPNDETCMQKGLNYYTDASRTQIETAIRAAVEHHRPYDLELELTSAKGVRKWVRTIGQPKIEDGRVVQVRGAFQDITERKHANQHIEHLNRVLRTIRDVNQLIVREHDPDRLIHEACRLMVANRGYAFVLIVLTDDDDRVVAWARAGAAASTASLDNLLADGSLPPCCDRTRPGTKVVPVADQQVLCAQCPIQAGCSRTRSLCARLDHENTVFGYLAAALDHDLSVDAEELGLFTEMAGDLAYALKALKMDQDHQTSERRRKALETQLIQAQKMESVGRLAGGVAHDYNNILSVIIGYAELALDKVAPDTPLHTDILEILAAAKRSTDITRQLLAFARQQTIAPKVLDLNATVDKMLNMLRRLIGEDIDLAWNPGPALWPIRIDPAQVDQIMANLCVNARDAIDGVGKVTIETQNADFDAAYCADHAGFKPGEYVLLTVKR